MAWVCGVSAVAATALLVAWAARRQLGQVGGQVLLTLLGLAVGAGLANLQVRLGRMKKLMLAGLATIVLSQSAYLLLVWTGWKSQTLLWRLWWVTLVPAVNLTHILLLRQARWIRRQQGGRAWLEWIERATLVLAVLTGILVLVLGLRRELLADPHPLHVWAVVAIWTGTILGTGISVCWYLWYGPWHWPRLSKGGATLLLASSHALLLAVGLYVGHRWAGTAPAVEAAPSPMALLSVDEVCRQTQSDLGRLQAVWQGLETLQRDLAAWDQQVAAAMARDGREYYLPTEDDQLRWRFVSFLSYRTGAAAAGRDIRRFPGGAGQRRACPAASCWLTPQ